MFSAVIIVNMHGTCQMSFNHPKLLDVERLCLAYYHCMDGWQSLIKLILNRVMQSNPDQKIVIFMGQYNIEM